MKLYFTEFAEKRARILQDIHDLSNTYILHIMCLFYFPNSPSRNHWKHEIVSYFVNLPKIKKGQKIKSKDIYQNLWGRVEDSFIDRYDGWIYNLNHKEKVNINHKSISLQEKETVYDYIEKITRHISNNLGNEWSIDPYELEDILEEVKQNG